MTSQFRSDAREGTKYLGLGIVWWIILLVVALIIGIAGWAFTVATSEVKGQGDAVIQRNSAENWLAAQKRFEDNYADIDATIVKIEQARPRITDGSATEEERIRFDGLRSYCASVVADYNADARDFLQEEFRAADLPSSISPSTCN